MCNPTPPTGGNSNDEPGGWAVALINMIGRCLDCSKRLRRLLILLSYLTVLLALAWIVMTVFRTTHFL
ncbi:hypothetical protein SAMN05421805_110130 [Saccharopolyspora antimicrobica]|uniref:Uncharacterized protein n=1 Tax=Saccharopolyspora antimicrobica TaxID=455193 RepID=A0A1I5F147_9PSEU|nr:hypothetical protein ATL45_1924 [Saccharopolyspora antimicrobica]SFO17403.1 hypothetical protein SAMN05421805_110130 [Saccharopolyspora antimicrobica]